MFPLSVEETRCFVCAILWSLMFKLGFNYTYYKHLIPSIYLLWHLEISHHKRLYLNGSYKYRASTRTMTELRQTPSTTNTQPIIVELQTRLHKHVIQSSFLSLTREKFNVLILQLCNLHQSNISGWWYRLERAVNFTTSVKCETLSSTQVFSCIFKLDLSFRSASIQTYLWYPTLHDK